MAWRWIVLCLRRIDGLVDLHIEHMELGRKLCMACGVRHLTRTFQKSD